jgi:uncharacterized alkaline shock family protein YloU
MANDSQMSTGRDAPSDPRRLADPGRTSMTATKDRPTGDRPTEEMAAAGGDRRGSALEPMSPMTGETAATATLVSDTGTTRIADSVVAKIAGLAARDIPGVFSMGTGRARRMGQLKSLVPGGGDTIAAGQGVSVQVGEKEAAVDLDLVTWYGQSIVDISDAVRRHVIGQVEGMTGLKVIEVNIQIDDIHVESQDQSNQQTRVQ